MQNFKVGDEVYIDFSPLTGHICIIDRFENHGRVRLHHPTRDYYGYFTSFPLNRNYEIRHVTPLDKLI